MVTVPAAQFSVRAAPEQRGKHDPTDLAQQQLLALQATFNLRHQVFGDVQIIKGLL